ncbi:hypothetical protein [Dryocola sp. BD586]|uniref:hypothetical protein n=1 Tax=Dryocola sp. BD586 TaxID=3133271 RepID=UPI003F4FFB9D
MSDSTQLVADPWDFILQPLRANSAAGEHFEQLFEKLTTSVASRQEMLSDSVLKVIDSLPGVMEGPLNIAAKLLSFTTTVATKLENDYRSAQSSGSSVTEYRAQKYAAQQAGGDQSRQAEFANEYQSMNLALNFDDDTAAQQSSQFMTSFRKITTVVDLLRDKAGAGLAAGLTLPLESVTNTILTNFPTIEQTFDQIIGGITQFGAVFANVINGTIGWITAIIGWWQQLDDGTQNVIGIVTALIAAWYLLNSAFLASPVGIILGLVAAIGLLYDDFMKWKAGGESFIDWGKWEPVLTFASDAIGSLAGTIKKLAQEFFKLLGIDFSTWSISSIFTGLLEGFNQLGEVLQKVGKLIAALKEGNWSEVVNIGKDLIGTGLKNSPAGMLMQNGADYAGGKIDQAWSAASDWLTGGEKKHTRRGEQGVLSPAALENLSQPDAALRLIGTDYSVDNQRYAWNSEVTQTASASVASPTFNNKTDIVINGARDPIEVGNEVERRQTSVYSRYAQMAMPGVS